MTMVVVFVFFFVGALINYNIGKTGKIGFKAIPTGDEVLRIMVTVATTAVLSTVTAEVLIHTFDRGMSLQGVHHMKSS